MKKYLLLLIILCNSGVYAQIGVGTTSPNASAALHVESTNKGVLIPRMNLAERDVITVGEPQKGLLIYQTDNTPGFYYYTGTAWTSFGNASFWSLTGNAGTNPTNDYLGTTDAEDFVLATNGVEAMRITAGGNVAIGPTTPSALFHLKDTSGPAANLLTETFGTTASGVSTTASATNYYFINNNDTDTCNASDGFWEILTSSGNSNTFCSGCGFDGEPNARAVINYDETASSTFCDQDATLVTEQFTATSSSIQISFDYAYILETADEKDLFEVTLYNETTPAASTTLFALNADDDNASYSNTESVISGNIYSLRFRYKGNYDYGAQLDNIIVDAIPSPLLRIDDGNQVAGHVLISDANGVATWQAPAAAVGSDQDWAFIGSGSTNADPIYHQGYVKVGTSPLFTTELEDSTHTLHVYNGNTSGSQLAYGSVEYFVDGETDIQTAFNFDPLTDGGINLGGNSAANRWANIYLDNEVFQTSDINTKTNISPLTYGLNEILELNPISFKWKKEMKDDFVIPRKEKEAKIGFSAQQLLKVLPEVVETFQWKVYEETPEELTKKESDLLAVSYTEIIPVAIKAIQEQQEQILELEKEILEVQKIINDLKK